MIQQNSPHEFFGVFELSDNGTVLSSLVRGDERFMQPSYGLVGKDFFGEIADFENTFDLRNMFRTFVTSRKSFDSFHFHCQYRQQTIKAKISMTRGHETDFGSTNDIVIMDIRNAL